MKVDWLIVGAGCTGCALAERIATQLGKSVLVVDRRDHIAGNSYDCYDEHGILVHQYGPHIFRTNDPRLWAYLSRFTEWRLYYHRVLAVVDGVKVPVPFNLNSLRALYPPKQAEKLEQLLIENYGFGSKVPILKLRESAPAELKALAEYIYEKVFQFYTVKQWGFTPEELSPTVTAGVPIYVSRDDRYFQEIYQGVPKLGFTEMMRRMLRHPKIRVLLNTDYRDIREEVKFDRMVCTGPIDEFFDYVHGPLPYRSIRFEYSFAPVEQFQEAAVVNYPNEYDFTRITEFKHLTGQTCIGSTVAREYSELHKVGTNDPYYPIPRDENAALYAKYEKETAKLKGTVLFAGRLGDYKYYSMHQAFARALSLFSKTIATSKFQAAHA